MERITKQTTSLVIQVSLTNILSLTRKGVVLFIRVRSQSYAISRPRHSMQSLLAIRRPGRCLP